MPSSTSIRIRPQPRARVAKAERWGRWLAHSLRVPARPVEGARLAPWGGQMGRPDLILCVG